MKLKFNKDLFYSFFGSQGFVLWSFLIGITAIFTIFLYPNFVIAPHVYKLGDVVERNIKARKDFIIEDKHATEIKRRQAAESVLTIYDYDKALASRLVQQIDKAFAELRKLSTAGSRAPERPVPAEAPEPETPPQNDMDPESGMPPDAPPALEISHHDKIWRLKENFEKTIGIPISDGAIQILENEKFSIEISSLINQLLEKILETGVVANKDVLLKESEKGIVLRAIDTRSEKIVRNLKGFYGLDQAKTMVRIIGDPLLKKINYTSRNLIVDLVQQLIQPNITLNRSKTEEMITKATADVKPVLYQIKAGEMLLREGERVTEVQLLKLRDLQRPAKAGNLINRCIGAAMISVCFLFTIYVLHFKPQIALRRSYNRHMLFIAAMLATFLMIAKISAALPQFLTADMPLALNASSMIFGVPIAAGAMTVCLFLGLDIALPFAALMAIFTAFIFQNRIEIFAYFLISGSMGACWMQQCKQRKVFIKAGGKLALLNILTAASINLYSTELSASRLLWDCVFASMGGIGSGIVTAGIAPLLEIIFNYTTDIKLLELANLEQPILRRLMIEAPGSYNHSVIVSSMAEAAAAEIGANPLMAKVCGYYHDIGKIKKPLYFIENQKDGKNRHDKLAPSMSALILISHVKNGVEMAEKCKLGQIIIDTIQQHHGTSLISFFYEKAKKQKGDTTIDINNFRYPGPKPQTRESAIVMLADVVEAASRTIDNPTTARIQGLVQNLFNKIFADGQLSDCDLTLKDLHQIAKSFNTMLNGIYHHRIKYPEKNATSIGKEKNDHSDKEQPSQAQHLTETSENNRADHLKRLGIS